MKEHDVRQRIESFLKRTAREMIISASMGLSVGLSGCGSDAVVLYGAYIPPDASVAGDVPIVPYHPNAPVDAGADVDVDAAASDAAADVVTPDADVDEGMTDGETH